jgi:pyruvate-ferredoxin/flavodoxin oxidoreductase
MQYGHVYVARVAFGAKDSQTIAALREAEAYNGPALIIAYSHCIAHGYPLHLGWISRSSRSTPATGRSSATTRARRPTAKVGFKLDSGAPKADLAKFMANETRFGILRNIAPARAEELAAEAQAQVRRHYALYQHLAAPQNGSNQAPASS